VAFSPLTIDDVICDHRCSSPTRQVVVRYRRTSLKQVIDLVAPFISELFNRSLKAGHFPDVFRNALVTPVVKKTGLDATNASSYRPISNLSVLSKLLERLVVRQLLNYSDVR